MEKAFWSTVAEPAGLSKEEPADLIRARMAELGGRLSGGEVCGLVLGVRDEGDRRIDPDRHAGRRQEDDD